MPQNVSIDWVSLDGTTVPPDIVPPPTGTGTAIGTPPTLYSGINVIPEGIGNITNPQEAFFGAVGLLFRRVDIHNADGTLWYANAPLIDGQVTVSYDQAERRTFEITLDNEDFTFRSDPDGLWYDKIVKIYRGVQAYDETSQFYQIGEFLIDTIDSPHFPRTTTLAGRDYAKMMMQSKFSEATGFRAGSSIDSVVRTIATNAGIAKLNIPATLATLGSDTFFESGTARWEAAAKLANDNGYELFFDAQGVLIMRLFVDPTTAPVSFDFSVGATGNLGNYSQRTNDTRIFNHVVVKGSGNGQLPVYGIAENNQGGSPTRISRIGRRTLVYDSKFISNSDAAEELAVSLLKINALESYEISLESLVAPWMDVGVAVHFNDPNPAPSAPTHFLLTDLTIPMKPGYMSGTAKRITIVH